MDNIGKFLYMAASALLFIFALTTSIYLYGTLHTYLESATGLTNVYNRVEGEAYEPTSSKRAIPWGEIYITIANMDQMHVSKVTIDGGRKIEIEAEDSANFDFDTLAEFSSKHIESYSIDGSEITYTLENVE